MRPYENDSPFGGHFGGPFAGMGRPNFDCPFRGGDSPNDHILNPRFGPFGWRRFDRSPERHCHREPEHPRWAPFEHGHGGCGHRGPSEFNSCGPHSRGQRHERGCHSPGTNRPYPWFGRNADHHCCGRRGQSECSEYSCRRRYKGSCGPGRHRSDCCHHAPCCDQRGQCHKIHYEGPSRKAHCKNCCESEPCNGGNKEVREPERDDYLDKKDDEQANERQNKIQLVVLWLLRELFWKRLKGHQLSDANMEITITSTSALQRSLGLDTEEK